MAILMMPDDGGKPVLHDFFGGSGTGTPALAKSNIREVGIGESSASAASSGSHEPVSTCSELGSAGRTKGVSEGFQFYHGSELDNRGRKRSNSDSAFAGSNSDYMFSVCAEPAQGSSMMKFRSHGTISEQHKKPHEADYILGMQPPRPSSLLMLERPAVTRPDLPVSNWDQPACLPVRSFMHCPSRIGQFTDKHSLSRSNDISASASIISQCAEDEGSRTGIKSSGVIDVVSANVGTTKMHQSVTLPSSRLNSCSQTLGMESDPQRCRSLTSSRQMTIFYAGQAHVFDDVHPNKADAIMALAGSSGGSWSTTYSPKANVQAYTHCREKIINNKTNIEPFAQATTGRHSISGRSSYLLPENAKKSASYSGIHHGVKMIRDIGATPCAGDAGAEGRKIS